jgi:3-(3-hydroxy-phenyl)propionate hydroxylase
MQNSSAHIGIVGAGPVGVVAAIAFIKKGFTVTLIEAEAAIDHGPRAATTHPSTLEMLAELGLVEEFSALGLVARHFQHWDGVDMTPQVTFDHDVLRDETPFPYVVQTEQHKLAELGLRRLANEDAAEVLMGTAVTAIEQDAGGVSVDIQNAQGGDRRRFDYLVGCDGGRSFVRKSMDIEFEGYTWPERFLVLTSLFDFERALGCRFRCYIAHPDEWSNLFKVMGDDMKGRWRAVFRAGENETDEEAFADASVRRRFAQIIDDHPLDLVVHRNIYRVHQRVAKTFRKGRVFLAGDAAHVNNPMGGLGLNCGIHDAMDLADTLHRVSTGAADASLLDRYDRRRRPLNIEFVQQQTIANKKRLEERDPAQRQANFDELRRIADDPVRHKQFLLRTSLIDSVRKAAKID